MRLSQIAKITKAKFSEIDDKEVKKFIIDSRIAKNGTFFVPLKGIHTDGHNYIQDAINKGSLGSFSCRPEIKGKNILFVEQPLQALTDIAKFNKSKVSIKIAITGTAGKTTTKELLAFSLMQLEDVYYTKGNYNNQIGLPLTLANIDKNYPIGIFELGASQKGDIKHLSSILNQDIAIITNIGYGHTEGLGGIKGVREEKLNITYPAYISIVREDIKTYLKTKKFITFGYKNADIKILDIQLTKNGTKGIIEYKNKINEVFLPVFNEKIIENVAIVFAVFSILGKGTDKIPELLKYFSPIKGRGNIIKYNKLTIIDDTYNANPTSVSNAINTLSKLKGKKILVLGDMLELGKYTKEKHLEIAEKINQANIDEVYLYGDTVKHIYEAIKNNKKAYLYDDKHKITEKLLTEKESSYILIKGSRSLKMEEVIEFAYNYVS